MRPHKQLIKQLMENPLLETEEKALDYYKNEYLGEYDSFEDFIKKVTEFNEDRPENLDSNIDWKKYAQSRKMDFSYLKLDGEKTVHIFNLLIGDNHGLGESE